MTWWDIDYPYRRPLVVTAPPDGCLVGHPVKYTIDTTVTVDNEKMRSDFADLEVLYNDNGTWIVLGRVIAGSTLTFPLRKTLGNSIADANYYIYYGNPALLSPPSRPSFTPSLWFLQEGFADINLSYTLPGENWVNGVSSTYLAKAVFAFYGEQIRLVSSTGPLEGMAEVQIDADPWQLVDLYASSVSQQIVFTSALLGPEQHAIRVRVSGMKSPQSNGNAVNIVRFEYRKTMKAVEYTEEVKDVVWTSIFQGII